MLLDIGGVVINLNNLVSFKIDTKGRLFYLQILMMDGTLYNIEYSNKEHLLNDIKAIQNATK